jgi:hypothetical protein
VLLLAGLAIGCGGRTAPPPAGNPSAGVPPVHDAKAVRLPMPPSPPAK